MRWYDPLRRQSEFAHVRRRGRSVSLPTFTAYLSPAGNVRPRVGVTVSKAVGKAVVRNLVRRRIRGALDALPATRPASGRLLFVAKPAAAGFPYDRLAGDVAAALARLAPPTA
jgi:ribonuclease P protein component